MYKKLNDYKVKEIEIKIIKGNLNKKIKKKVIKRRKTKKIRRK